MLRRFGSLIWRQTRDISVYNYPKTMVYEITTNQGYIYLLQDKDNNKVEAVNGRFECFTNLDFSKPTEKQNPTIQLSNEK